MGSRLKFAFAAAAMIYGAGAYAADAATPWVTPLKCGDAQARFTVSCSKAKSANERNSCKMPQKLEFLDQSGAVIKTVNLPVYAPGEQAKYKAAGTDQQMFAMTYSCVKLDGKDYFNIYYSANTGAEEFNEKENQFSASGEFVPPGKLRDRIGVADGENPDRNKDHHIKAASFN
ncbi:hypothetical protein [Amantichitinum ursilacus]|uniref:Uncharacterized protein n=1 Tax=Amantichitinum ursilacus TaxID=857265 RepID=A0A0N1JS03_9NEIS|nr:hypothetical protein [Amantichitinum ursilacus]KPC50390.1 hypothetical protein WG78_17320 [Amantichitinum ursilacus]